MEQTKLFLQKLKSENNLYSLILKSLFSLLIVFTCSFNIFGQVKYYNSQPYFRNYISPYKKDTLDFLNFNTKPVSFVQYKINYTFNNSSFPNYEQFCDSTGKPVFTRFGFSYFDAKAQKLPLYFPERENEISFTFFSTNKTKFSFSFLHQNYHSRDQTIFEGYFNIIRFDKNYKIKDTLIMNLNSYQVQNPLLEYSSNCDFNYLLLRKSSNYYRKLDELVYRIDSQFHKVPEILYTSETWKTVLSISPKGDIICIKDETFEAIAKSCCYTLLYEFNNQNIKIKNPNYFAAIKTDRICFSSDGQYLFAIQNDSVMQYSLKKLKHEEIMKSAKLIGRIEGKYIKTIMHLFPDENIYFNSEIPYVIKKQSDVIYHLEKTSIFGIINQFTGSRNTALYHPHFRIELKDTVCINEDMVTKTNHIDSFATYKWILKDAMNNLLFQSFSISPNFKPSKPGHYTVQLIYRWRCNSMDSTIAHFYVKDYPKIEKIKDSTICFNGYFTARLSSNFKEIIWSNNQLGNNFKTNKEGNYYVAYTDGCRLYKDTFQVKVIDEIKPQQENSEIVLCSKNETFKTSFQLPKNSGFKWSDSYALLNRTINTYGTYEITFYNQCQSIDESLKVLYSENKTEIFIPNAITPNGDQLNENWEINDPSNIKEIEWEIFNLWGEKIDEGKSFKFDLRKLIKADKNRQGIYYYHFVITFQCNSVQKIYNGIFHIME